MRVIFLAVSIVFGSSVLVVGKVAVAGFRAFRGRVKVLLNVVTGGNDVEKSSLLEVLAIDCALPGVFKDVLSRDVIDYIRDSKNLAKSMLVNNVVD